MNKLTYLNKHALKKILLFLIYCLFTVKSAFSQENIMNGMQADILKINLQKQKIDSDKIKSFLNLAWYQILKPKELKVDLDSARNWLTQAAPLIKRNPTNDNLGFYYLIYAEYYNEVRQKKHCEDALEKAIGYLRNGHNQFLLGSAYADKMNRISLSLLTAPVKLSLIKLAADAYSHTSNKRNLGDCLRLMADLHLFLKDDPHVLPELDSAKRLYQEAKSGEWQQLYILYAKYYNKQDNNEKLQESILNALRVTNLDDSSSNVSKLKLFAATVYYRLKDYQQCLNYSLAALAIAKKEKNNSYNVYEIARYAVIAYAKLGRPEMAYVFLNKLEEDYPDNPNQNTMEHLYSRLSNYIALKQYEKGWGYFNLLDEQIKRRVINEDVALSRCYNLMINFCIDTRQPVKANDLLHHWDIIRERSKHNNSMQVNYLNAKISIDTAEKDFRNAVISLFAARNLNDSIVSSTHTRQLREMEFQYNTEKKNNENKLQQQKILYLTEQQRLERESLKAAEITKNVLLVSGFCILIIAGLIYRQYVNGRNTNRIIAGKNKHLEELLEENDFLMKEVHHRVKNNLQIITSLLNSQSAFLDEGAALDAIMKSKGRVESIALIHQKLYRSENQSSVYMPEYIQELVLYLKESFVGDDDVWFDITIAPIHLDVSDAVPIGLIINESVTNSIKHAFSSPIRNDSKVIQINLLKMGNRLDLIIRDNGKGFKASSNANNSFGLLLINGLSKDLGGELSMYNDGGTVIQIIFKPTSIFKNELKDLYVELVTP